jgi:hypothetical protein
VRGRRSTNLDVPGVGHDSTSHDGEEGQGDGLGKTEPGEVSNLPILGGVNEVVQVGVLQVEADEVGKSW